MFFFPHLCLSVCLPVSLSVCLYVVRFVPCLAFYNFVKFESYDKTLYTPSVVVIMAWSAFHSFSNIYIALYILITYITSKVWQYCIFRTVFIIYCLPMGSIYSAKSDAPPPSHKRLWNTDRFNGKRRSGLLIWFIFLDYRHNVLP